jgi:hypothetical protein
VIEHVSTSTSLSADEMRWMAYQSYGSAEVSATIDIPPSDSTVI